MAYTSSAPSIALTSVLRRITGDPYLEVAIENQLLVNSYRVRITLSSTTVYFTVPHDGCSFEWPPSYDSFLYIVDHFCNTFPELCL